MHNFIFSILSVSCNFNGCQDTEAVGKCVLKRKAQWISTRSYVLWFSLPFSRHVIGPETLEEVGNGACVVRAKPSFPPSERRGKIRQTAQWSTAQAHEALVLEPDSHFHEREHCISRSSSSNWASSSSKYVSSFFSLIRELFHCTQSIHR